MNEKNKYENSIDFEKADRREHKIPRYEAPWERTDYDIFMKVLGLKPTPQSTIAAIQTIDDLLERDNQREEDGLPRRIRLGKIAKPSEDKKEQVVVVPTTTEPKFYHDDAVTEDEEENTTGTGEEAEGEVLGEQQAQPEEGEGEGEGAGEGSGGNHDVVSEAFDLGKILTEKFQLPNLKQKGKKPSLTKFKYDLTDKNRGFGQVVDKKATLKKIVETNILLGNIDPNEPFDPEKLIINPKDEIYRILSKEKDFETQAVVFFLRDYSGSMQGAPTEAVVTQHLFIYSWLMYQYKNNVESRFILHDQEAKEVEDFYTYHNSSVAGGTNVYPAYELVLKIIEEENLARDNNIYVFHGTDGDDWDTTGKYTISAIRKMMPLVNRIGVTVARNSWGGAGKSSVERYIESSKLLTEKKELMRMDVFSAAQADEKRLIDGIKELVS